VDVDPDSGRSAEGSSGVSAGPREIHGTGRDVPVDASTTAPGWGKSGRLAVVSVRASAACGYSVSTVATVLDDSVTAVASGKAHLGAAAGS
jgi:hypothetical protein